MHGLNSDWPPCLIPIKSGLFLSEDEPSISPSVASICLPTWIIKETWLWLVVAMWPVKCRIHWGTMILTAKSVVIVVVPFVHLLCTTTNAFPSLLLVHMNLWLHFVQMCVCCCPRLLSLLITAYKQSPYSLVWHSWYLLVLPYFKCGRSNCQFCPLSTSNACYGGVFHLWPKIADLTDKLFCTNWINDTTKHIALCFCVLPLKLCKCDDLRVHQWGSV